MAKSKSRFYQVQLKDRPALWDDLGSNLTIGGIILEHSEGALLLHTPGSISNFELPLNQELWLSDEEFSKWLQCTDDPKILLQDEKGRVKAIHRKLRYQISGAIQQTVWVADGFKCMFCLKPMGEVQLTVDHFIPLELGGANNPSNYLSACRKCNKEKGNTHPREWCKIIIVQKATRNI